MTHDVPPRNRLLREPISNAAAAAEYYMEDKKYGACVITKFCAASAGQSCAIMSLLSADVSTEAKSTKEKEKAAKRRLKMR